VSAELALIPALLMGLLGSVHCAGMCGGIACVLSMSLPARARRSAAHMLPWLLAYNAGRIASYAAAGALAGALGAGALALLPAAAAPRAGMVVSGVFLVLLGLYLGGWWRLLGRLEQVGAGLWRRIEPHGRRFLPARTPLHAAGLGVVWGWLPCGLVYTALVWSLAAGDAATGAALMAAFGAGTLPMLLAIGTAGERLAGLSGRRVLQQGAGAIIVALGLYTLAAGPALPGHGVHPAAHGGDPAHILCT